ncbi:MAG TPA: hypothetical protein VKX17_19140 [Planctomycetota bacterium]|nr:hypothetical protein [Planctomycetota bacterium]
MNVWTSKCLLALALLQGFIPADQCVLKLAGICCCDTAAVVPARSCCHAQVDNARDNRCNHLPTNDGNRKPCCAYTPAHNLNAVAPETPVADAYSDCIANASLTALEPMSAQTSNVSIAPAACMSPRGTDTPLFVHVHSFLL